MEKLVYSMDEVSAATSISKSMLKSMVKVRYLKTFRIGNREKVSADELERFVASLSASDKPKQETKFTPKMMKFKAGRWYLIGEDADQLFIAETPFWSYGVHRIGISWHAVLIHGDSTTAYRYIGGKFKSRHEAEEKCQTDFAKRVKRCEKLV